MARSAFAGYTCLLSMRRFVAAGWWVSSVGVFGAAGCEPDSKAILSLVAPDASADADVDAGPDGGRDPSSGADGSAPVSSKPNTTTSKSPKPRDAGTKRDAGILDPLHSHAPTGDGGVQDAGRTGPVATHGDGPDAAEDDIVDAGVAPTSREPSPTNVADASEQTGSSPADAAVGPTATTTTWVVEAEAGPWSTGLPDAGGDVSSVVDSASTPPNTSDAPTSSGSDTTIELDAGSELDASTEPPEEEPGRVPPDLTGCTEVNLSPSRWSVVYADSAEANNPPEFAFDDNWSTHWLTGSGPSELDSPHELVLDLGAERALLGLTYLARQDVPTNGTIENFQLYVSLDGVAWFDAVLEAEFANTKVPQALRFTPVTARYVRLIARSAHNGEPEASIAELEILAAKCPGDPDEPPASAYEPGVVGPYLNGVFPSIDPAVGGQLPPTALSQTGAFTQLQPLVANPGLFPYDVNQPLWSDRAAKWRWVALANDGTFDQSQERLTFDSVEPWQFPAGTVFVKHFELGASDVNPDPKIKIETRFLVVAASGGVYGVTYRWNDQGTEATLLTGSETRTLSIETSGQPRTQTWTFPARTECDYCHNSVAKYVLGVNAWQLNRDFDYPNGSRDNQLQRLRALGAFTNPFPEGAHTSMAHAVSVKDTEAPTDARLKSYMAANCSHCHRPNAVESPFDARFQVPLQNVVRAETAIADSTNQYLVKPGLPFESELFVRDSSLGLYGMPPLAKSLVDQEYLALLQQWISSLQ